MCVEVYFMEGAKYKYQLHQYVTSNIGGAGGIRTLDRALQPYNGLANRRLQPLGHSSVRADMPDAGAGRKQQISGRRLAAIYWLRACFCGFHSASSRGSVRPIEGTKRPLATRWFTMANELSPSAITSTELTVVEQRLATKARSRLLVRLAETMRKRWRSRNAPIRRWRRGANRPRSAAAFRRRIVPCRPANSP
jgi:hypothetical protein